MIHEITRFNAQCDGCKKLFAEVPYDDVRNLLEALNECGWRRVQSKFDNSTLSYCPDCIESITNPNPKSE